MEYSEKVIRKVVLRTWSYPRDGLLEKEPGGKKTKIHTGHFLFWCFIACKQNP